MSHEHVCGGQETGIAGEYDAQSVGLGGRRAVPVPHAKASVSALLASQMHGQQRRAQREPFSATIAVLENCLKRPLPQNVTQQPHAGVRHDGMMGVDASVSLLATSRAGSTAAEAARRSKRAGADALRPHMEVVVGRSNAARREAEVPANSDGGCVEESYKTGE